MEQKHGVSKNGIDVELLYGFVKPSNSNTLGILNDGAIILHDITIPILLAKLKICWKRLLKV